MTAVHQGERRTALWSWKRAGKATQSCQACGVRSQAENAFLMDKPCHIYLKEMPLCSNAGTCSESLKRSALTFKTRMATAPHQGASYLSGADIEPANRGDGRDFSLTRTIPFDHRLELNSFLCWMHFLICPVFIAFKKAICYIVHRPSR